MLKRKFVDISSKEQKYQGFIKFVENNNRITYNLVCNNDSDSVIKLFIVSKDKNLEIARVKSKDIRKESNELKDIKNIDNIEKISVYASGKLISSKKIEFSCNDESIIEDYNYNENENIETYENKKTDTNKSIDKINIKEDSEIIKELVHAEIFDFDVLNTPNNILEYIIQRENYSRNND